MLTTTTLTDAEQVAALRAKGVGEPCIARKFGDLAARDVELAMTRPDYVRDHGAMIVNIRAREAAPRGPVPCEASVQAKIVRYLKVRGLCVYRVGQRNARGTQDAGVSDLIVLGETVTFVEVKRRDGKQSAAQKRFAEMVRRAGGTYICARSINDVELCK